MVLIHADRNRGSLFHDRIGRDHALIDEVFAGERQGNKSAGDGGRPRAAIGLQHIAVDGDLVFPQCGKVTDGPKRTPDQSLDFLGPAGLLACGGFAAPARVCCAR